MPEQQAIVHHFAATSCAELGLELWDLVLQGRRDGLHVIVTIDKDGGVTLDDCETLSHALEARLDEADPIAGTYLLEVESPGPKRRLRGPHDVPRFAGQEVFVELLPQVSGRRRFTGRLRADGGPDALLIDGVDGEVHALRWQEVGKIQLTGRMGEG